MHLKIRLTLMEEILGTATMNPKAYQDFIAALKPETSTPDNELETLPTEDQLSEDVKAATTPTVFHRDKDGSPILYDYQIKGFCKDACSMLARLSEANEDEDGTPKKGKKAVNESGKIRAYKKEIDGLVFVFPRQIKAQLPEGGVIGLCERPLRAQTAKGERIALAHSETLPPGTVFEITVQLLADRLEPALMEWLDYGQLRGLGQWRNSGKGRFTYEIVQ